MEPVHGIGCHVTGTWFTTDIDLGKLDMVVDVRMVGWLSGPHLQKMKRVVKWIR